MAAFAFDDLAEQYDQAFTRSAVGQVLRAMVWQRLPRLFGRSERILELGCGTGEDAVHLAQLGHHVVASDASAQMLQLARIKAERAHVSGRIRFVHAPMESLAGVLGNERFDGVFSNFGAINCVADLPVLAEAVATRLAPGAPLVFIAMGRHVPWEWAWYLARGDRARAFRRLRADGVEWRGLRIHYPTPARLGRELAPWFKVARRSGLGFALPPSYAARWLDSAPRTLAALSAIERILGRFTAPLADHYILEAVRA